MKVTYSSDGGCFYERGQSHLSSAPPTLSSKR